MTSATLTSLRQAEDEYLQKFMDRFRRIVVQINNLNPDIALHCMLLALRLGKFAGSLCKKKKTLVAWTSCVNKPKATSRWKKSLGSGMRLDKPEKIPTSEKEAPRPNHTS